MKRTQRIAWLITLVLLFNSALVAAASVIVSPASIQVKPGAQVQFTTSGAVDDLVIWNLSGVGCSGITCGTITASGLYTAPAVAPNPPTVKVTATSLFDVSETGTANVSIGSAAEVSVTISPTSVTVTPHGQQQFTAIVTGSANKAVNWTVSGIGCVSGSCGTITSSGLYTAPAAIPNPPLATVTATSVADPTKSQSAMVAIQPASSISVIVTPGFLQLAIGTQQQFSATVTGSSNKAVKWSVSGRGCSGTACGIISGSGLYTAPSSVPNPPEITITATSVADPSESGSATATIVSIPQLTVSPSSPQVKPGAQVQFTASGPSSGLVVWSLSGTGCSGITCGKITSTGLYTAPSTAPNPPTVTVTATALLNTAITGSTIITVVAPTQVSVSVSPSTVQLNTGAQQQFTATVSGTGNKSVSWSLSGFGCAGTDCGTITASGLYTAPAIAPNPAIVNVTATSNADTTKSATAAVFLTQKISVSVSPGSVEVAVNATQQFTATVAGSLNTTVTWSLSGAGCSGASCGSISSMGLYTAPASLPKPSMVKVTATSNADGVSSGSATVTLFLPISVTIAPQTAVVSITDTQQFRATVTGTTNGAVFWSISGPGCSGSQCGTISSTGLYTAPGSVPASARVTVKAVSQADSAVSATATITIAPSNNSKLKGQFAFQFTGFDANGIYQSAGSFTADGNGKLTSGLEDVNNTTGPSTALAITGTYQLGADNRGVLTIKSTLGVLTYRFALNLEGTKASLISFDSSGVHGSGVIELQDPTAFDPSVIVGGYVMSLAGMDINGSRIGALGLIFPDGSGFISGASLDVNEGGSVSPTFAGFTGTYTVDASGRGTLTLVVPGFDGGTFDFAFYVVSANELLIVSTDPLSFGNPIFSGPADMQTGAPFLTTSFSGPSVFTFAGNNGSAPQDSVGRFSFNGASNVVVNYDENNGGQVTVGNVLTGAYDVELNGRGTLNLFNPSNGSTTIWYLYAIAPNEAFVLDATTGAVSIGEMKPQVAVQPFSNSNIVGTYEFGSGEPIVATAPVSVGVASFDGGSSNFGQGAITGTQDVNLGTSLSAGEILAGTYSVPGVSGNGRGSILLTSPAGKTIAVWVISDSEFVGLNTDSTTPQPTILYFQQ